MPTTPYPDSPAGAPSVVRDLVAELPLPAPALLAQALAGAPTAERHAAMAARVEALHRIEARQPPAPASPGAPEHLRIAAWNLERCARVDASAALLRRAGAGAVLLSEMDLGMARSGNRHTARDLAAALGMGHAYGVEFVELGLGVGDELRRCAGMHNTGALHGNALLSALPFRDPFMVRLDAGGAWFGLEWHHRRLGGRIAVGATVDLARGPVLLVSLHLENRSTPDERRVAAERLLAALPAGVPAAVAGDLNTAAMPRDGSGPEPDWFERAERREPLFAAFRAAGFGWTDANTPEQTRRAIRDGRPAPWVQRIDWILLRGLSASNPRVWPAADADGAPLSDHEMITVDVA